MNLVLLNFLGGLATTGLVLLKLALLILVAMIGIAYTREKEVGQQNFVPVMLWVLVVLSAVTFIAEKITNSTNATSIEQMIKESDAKADLEFNSK
ncbi:MAG: hypothetical protein JKY54_01675 [Flavobacteriales bacterium]|nr:hypothetical protein [Flavobacteriales bacterium]